MRQPPPPLSLSTEKWLYRLNTLPTPYYVQNTYGRQAWRFFSDVFSDPYAEQEFIYSLKNTQKGHFIIQVKSAGAQAPLGPYVCMCLQAIIVYHDKNE